MLVALFDRRDRHHRSAAVQWETLRGPISTVWPVITEALHLLDFSAPSCEAIFDLVETGAMPLAPLSTEDVPRIRALMKKYADVPMDLADACLVRVAEREKIGTVYTFDGDFRVYAPAHRKRLKILPARG
jgi:predicted nucleic acid-binding protein